MKTITLLVAMLLPLPVMAAGNGYEVCRNLAADITNEYQVSNLEFMPNGNPYVSESLVSCNYRATRPTLNGDLPVMVIALLNTANNRYTVEFK